MQSRLADYRGEEVRVTGERLNHLLEDHPEIKGREHWLSETLAAPETVVRSRKDPTATLYYRRYNAERIGEKYLCVVVKETPADHFMLTAYFTNRIKQGETVWTAK